MRSRQGHEPDEDPVGVGRDARLVRNETFFREANELMAREAAERASRHATFPCECSSEGCLDRIELPLSGYEHIRSNGEWFVLKPGHEAPSVEIVIERQPAYFVVEKQGTADTISRATDPRE
jgi:hypothetical protein